MEGTEDVAIQAAKVLEVDAGEVASDAGRRWSLSGLMLGLSAESVPSVGAGREQETASRDNGL